MTDEQIIELCDREIAAAQGSSLRKVSHALAQEFKARIERDRWVPMSERKPSQARRELFGVSEQLDAARAAIAATEAQPLQRAAFNAIRATCDAADIPTHADRGGSLPKPLTPQERLALLGSALAAAEAERDRVANAMPKTADGVPIVPGADLFVRRSTGWRERVTVRAVGSDSVSIEWGEGGMKTTWCEPSELFASAAALSAPASPAAAPVVDRPLSATPVAQSETARGFTQAASPAAVGEQNR